MLVPGEVGRPPVKGDGLDRFRRVKRLPVIAIFVKAGDQPLGRGFDRRSVCLRYPVVVGDRFDVVGMFDVLEHLDNATLALTQVRSLLHEDGRLILTVPAHTWLWSREDAIAGHKRRYTRSVIARELEKAGFQVIENRYFFVLILPLLWLRKFLCPDRGLEVTEQEQGKEISLNPVLNQILLGLCRLENRLRTLMPNRFGGSLMVVAKKA